MGTHGRGRIGEALIGSVSRDVVHSLRSAVLLTRAPEGSDAGLTEPRAQRPPRSRPEPRAAEPAPLRKDAARSRHAILAAARELFASGRDVPMYEIGRHAGVGQATLYRHFPDRSAIVAAISREQVERIEQLAAEHAQDPAAIRIVLATSAEMIVSIHDLVEILRARPRSRPCWPSCGRACGPCWRMSLPVRAQALSCGQTYRRMISCSS